VNWDQDTPHPHTHTPIKGVRTPSYVHLQVDDCMSPGIKPSLQKALHVSRNTDTILTSSEDHNYQAYTHVVTYRCGCLLWVYMYVTRCLTKTSIQVIFEQCAIMPTPSYMVYTHGIHGDLRIVVYISKQLRRRT
jgi:hypothetical protein